MDVGGGTGAEHGQAEEVEAGSGEPSQLFPPQPGGYYVLYIQATPEGDCLSAPHDKVSDEEKALQALVSQWRTAPATRQNLNVVAGDYIEAQGKGIPLFQVVIGMDEAKFGTPPSTGRPSPRASRT